MSRYSIETIFKAVDKMTAPVSKMQKKVKEFTESASKGAQKASDFFTSMATRATAFGTVALGAFTTAAGGVALFVSETNKANQEMLNMSKAMGVSYDTTKAMDGILSSMTLNWENFTDLIEEQANKFGELKGAGEMKKLNEAIALTGLSVEKLQKMNPEQQFIAIADALVKMKDGQKAAFIADEIWGGEGNKIIQGLRARKQTVSEVIAEYQRFNFYTKEGQKATEDFNKAMSPISKMANSIRSQFAALIGQALVPYLQKATLWATTNKEVIQTRIAEYAQKIADAMAWLATNMGTILTWAQRFAIAIGIFIALTTVLRTFVLVMTAVNLVMAMNPISLIIIAIVGLIAVIGYLINKFFGWEAVLKTTELAMYAIGAAVLALMGPVGWLIGAAVLIYTNWGNIKGFFSDLWTGVVNIFNSAATSIMSVIDRITNGITNIINLGGSIAGKVKGFLGFGGGGAESAGTRVASPQQRTANAISETKTTSEVTIMDRTGRAKVTRGPLGSGVRLQQSGGF